jgi:hypothetical protein
VQLIPAWIDNVQRVMPKGEVVPVPILCTVTFGAPMQLQPGEDKRDFLDRARDAVLALRPRGLNLAEACALPEPEQQVALLFVPCSACCCWCIAWRCWLLTAARRRRPAARSRATTKSCSWRDLRACALGRRGGVLGGLGVGPVGATLAFGVFSFLALREFITLVHTRRGDHRSLILAFFVVLPLQYLLVGNRHFDLFTVFIPVYVFLAIPVVSALAGDPERFLERNAKIQWGIMVCVYGLSHAPALLLLDLPRLRGRGAFLLFFLVMVAAARRSRRSWPAAGCAAGRWCGRSTAASRGAPGARALSAALAGGALFWITPFKPARRRHGAAGRRLRHAGRAGDEGAEEGRRRALLGQPQPRSPAPSACWTAWRRCASRRRCSSTRCAGTSSYDMRILGIDPGLQPPASASSTRRHRGWPTWPAAPSAPAPWRHAATCPAAEDHLRRRARGGARYQPDCASVEIVFVNVNPQEHAAAGPGPRRGAGGAGVVRPAGGRVHRAADEEGRGRPRPGRKDAGAGDGDAPAEAAGPARQGRRRRAGPGHLARPRGASGSPRLAGASAGRA